MIYLGYLDQSTDDLVIVSDNARKVVGYLKNSNGSEWINAYVDIWKDDQNIGRVCLDTFVNKYL